MNDEEQLKSVQSAQNDAYIDPSITEETEAEQWTNTISGSSSVYDETKKLTFNKYGVLLGDPKDANFIHQYLTKDDIQNVINTNFETLGVLENSTIKNIDELFTEKTKDYQTQIDDKVTLKTYSTDITDSKNGLKAKVTKLENLDCNTDGGYSKASIDSNFVSNENLPIALNNGVPGFTVAEYDEVDDTVKSSDNKLYFIFE